ncbi:Gastrula zinc finger protein xFG20-1 [Cocos nucifera]|uniref:Gastrula zinc finger protein xFG20-1 n=1 Tax=Cocos nucifera TaxID=13894 RepID=A0A8K0IS40_COCNU|nr:Gastrula zinc finger protein xFG20-1 [Cocos nucifera]
MATIRSFFKGFLSLFLLLILHLGCCGFSPTPNPDTDQQQSPPKRRKISPSPPSSASAPKSRKSFSLSVRSYLGRLFPSSSRTPKEDRSPHAPISPPSPTITKPIPLSPDVSDDKAPSVSEPEISAAVHTSFASRCDLFPCPACGEVLSKPHLLDLHQTTHHSLSELSDADADSGNNIVRIIFLSGWKGKSSPTIHRILKIHNAPRTLARFEEYRDTVRSRASRRGGDERCIADGNERLRFYCSTILCSLGRDGVCGSPYCSACGIVRHGFAGKQAELDGIATHATSWAAHVSLPEDLEREFAYLHVRRAMLVIELGHT